jgi:hypothetical protein
MGSRRCNARLACLVLVSLTILASLVCRLPLTGAQAAYGGVTPIPNDVLYTSTPTDPERPSPTPTSISPATLTPTLLRSRTPTATQAGSVTPTSTTRLTMSPTSTRLGPGTLTATCCATPSRTDSASMTPSQTMTPSVTSTAWPGTSTPSVTVTIFGTSVLTPTLTITPTSPVTPTPTPRPIQLPIIIREQEFIPNGAFESGQFEPHWYSAGTLARQVVSTVRHEGRYAALLGDPEYPSDGGCPVGAAAIYQVVEIPQYGHATLRFWYLMQSYDTKQFDYLAVIIAPTPDLAATPVFIQGRTYWDEWLWSSGWREAKIPLSAFKGQTVCIMLCNAMTNEDGWYNTWTYVDEVQIEYRP